MTGRGNAILLNNTLAMKKEPYLCDCDIGSETPGALVTADEGAGDALLVNDTLTEALLLVFHVADGSRLGSGFSATYGGLHQGVPPVSRTQTHAFWRSSL